MGTRSVEVILGMSNDKLVEVKKGLDSGESVALSPILLMSEEQKREAFGTSQDSSKKDWADAKKIGTAPVVASTPAAPRKPGQEPSGPGRPAA